MRYLTPAEHQALDCLARERHDAFLFGDVEKVVRLRLQTLYWAARNVRRDWWRHLCDMDVMCEWRRIPRPPTQVDYTGIPEGRRR